MGTILKDLGPTMWLILYWAIAVPLEHYMPHKIANGRLISRPMRKFFHWKKSNRFFRTTQYFYWFMFMLLAGQITHIKGSTWSMIFWGPMIVLYIDDWLTGDDEEWKKRIDMVRNKIKWQMELPVPAEDKVAS